MGLGQFLRKILGLFRFLGQLEVVIGGVGRGKGLSLGVCVVLVGLCPF